MANKYEIQSRKIEEKLKKLSKEELIDLVYSLIEDQTPTPTPKSYNKVSIADVEVESNVESLNKCKEIAQDLIKKNHKFIANRKNKINFERMGYLS